MVGSPSTNVYYIKTWGIRLLVSWSSKTIKVGISSALEYFLRSTIIGSTWI